MGTPQVPPVPPATSAPPQAPPVPSKYRKPPAGPTAENVRDQTRWQELSEQSLASTQAAAEKWRTGLAAFVTLATGGLLLKGPSAASDVTTGWRIALTILALGGLLAAIAGLWLALRAAAGTPAKLNLAEVVARYGGVRQFEVACALAASAQLRLARLMIAGSLLLFAAAIGTWWWAPPNSAQLPALISVTTPRGTVCGTLISADDGAFTVRQANASGQVRVPLGTATNVQIVASCLGQGGRARIWRAQDSSRSVDAIACRQPGNDDVVDVPVWKAVRAAVVTSSMHPAAVNSRPRRPGRGPQVRLRNRQGSAGATARRPGPSRAGPPRAGLHLWQMVLGAGQIPREHPGRPRSRPGQPGSGHRP